MKVSLNLAQEFSNVNLKAIPRDELLKRIGAQLGAVEEVIDWAPKYQGVVVAKVLKCEKHPNADKLSVCMIDAGTGEPVQVVCGAPNVREGLIVAWIPPGATVPSTHGVDPFVLEARDLRGIVSNGMLASAKELGLSDDHGGILEIDEDVAPGTPLTQLFGLDDVVIDLENKMFTHRPDCFGVLGVARELAGISGLKFESPSWYRNIEFTTPSSKLTFKIENDIEDLVPQFVVQVVQGVKIQPSPLRIQALLTRVGIKPINNIVDLTNYYMHLTAQPTHAYDYDKLKAISGGEEPVLFPRMAHEGETLTLLGGKTIKLTQDDIVIATDQKVVGLAGIMGGAETEVDASTKNILVEAATFDMYSIRRSSMRHGLFTEASARFNKGQSTLQNTKVQLKLVSDICAQTGAQAGVSEELHLVPETRPVVTSVDFINQRLGSNLSGEEMKQLLENVEFEVRLQDNNLQITQPFWRTDIEIPEDIVEEVGRLYGFDKLPIVLPARTAKPTQRSKMLDFKQRIREKLVASGANEVLTYSFVHGDLQRKTGTDPEKYAFHIRNALSPDLQYYRTRLIPSLLEKVQGNIRSDMVRPDNNDFAIFEIGKAHIKGLENDEGLPQEMERLALVFAADDKTAARKYQGAAFYQAKKFLVELTNGQVVFTPLGENGHAVSSPHEPGRSAVVSIDSKDIGIIGEFSRSVKQSFKLPDFCAGFEIDISLLQELLKEQVYAPVPAFPKTTADITLEVGAVTHADVENTIGKVLEEYSATHGYVATLAPRDIFSEQDSDKKRLTFRMWLAHPERTLTTEEVNTLVDKIAQTAQNELSATRI